MSQDWTNYPILPQNDYQSQYLGPNTDTPHYAADVQTPFRTPIKSLFSGKVVSAGCRPWGGEAVIETTYHAPGFNPDELFGIYHLSELNVKKGDTVNSGDQLGLSGGDERGTCPTKVCKPGQTGNCYSTGVHTHAFLQDKHYFGHTQDAQKWPVSAGTASVPGGRGISYGPDVTPVIQSTGTFGYTKDPGEALQHAAGQFFDPSKWYADILSSLGITNTKDLLYRLAFIGAGTLLIIVGVVMLAKSVAGGVAQTAVQAAT